MNKFITKKKVLWGSFVGVVFFMLIAGTRGVPFLCDEYDRGCMKQYDNVSVLFLIFLPLFILSLITYWMREEIFRAWLRFAYWWTPLTMVLVLMTHDSSGGFGIPSIISRESVSMIFSALFLIISLILISYKSFALRKKG